MIPKDGADDMVRVSRGEKILAAGLSPEMLVVEVEPEVVENIT